MVFASLPLSQYVAKKVALGFARLDRRSLKAHHAIADKLVKNFAVLRWLTLVSRLKTSLKSACFVVSDVTENGVWC